MLDINWGDVENVLKLCIPHLVFLAVVLVAAIAVMIAVKGKDKPAKFMARAQAGMAIFVALAVVVNLVFGSGQLLGRSHHPHIRQLCGGHLCGLQVL